MPAHRSHTPYREGLTRSTPHLLVGKARVLRESTGQYDYVRRCTDLNIDTSSAFLVRWEEGDERSAFEGEGTQGGALCGMERKGL